jgi:DNA-binding NarL/FixJ family response regulator
MNPITILLADDQTIIRDGLRALLETNADIRVVAEAKNGNIPNDRRRTLHSFLLRHGTCRQSGHLRIGNFG